MNYQAWRTLEPGDIVDIIAPGSSVESAAIKRAENFLKSWGLVPRVQKNILKPYMFHSSPDEMRSEQLIKALTAKDSKAVWCMRGGYGANRLLPALSKVKRPSRPKIFIGLSDITSIHLYLNEKWKWPTIHGPILDRVGRGDLSDSQIDELEGIISGTLEEVEFPNLTALNSAARKVKTLRGSVIGGNLVTLQSTWGTPYQASLKNKFVFGEEIGERAYRVDRILEHLRQLPDFNSCKGVFFGTFTDCQESNGKNLILPTLKRFAENVKVPVFMGLLVGHDVRQRCLPMGTNAVVTKQSGKFNLSVESGF